MRVNLSENYGEPSSKAKYYNFSDSEKYCEGKLICNIHNHKKALK